MNAIQRYRRRPLECEAIRFSLPLSEEVVCFCGDFLGAVTHPKLGTPAELEILTLEDGLDRRAKHVATEGDYLIKGVEGELYACKPDIFHKTYEIVEN